MAAGRGENSWKGGDANGLWYEVWCENYNKKGNKEEGNKEKIDMFSAGGKPAVLFVLRQHSAFSNLMYPFASPAKL